MLCKWKFIYIYIGKSKTFPSSFRYLWSHVDNLQIRLFFPVLVCRLFCNLTFWFGCDKLNFLIFWGIFRVFLLKCDLQCINTKGDYSRRMIIWCFNAKSQNTKWNLIYKPCTHMNDEHDIYDYPRWLVALNKHFILCFTIYL